MTVEIMIVPDTVPPVISEIDAITAEATGPSTAVAIPFPTVSDDLDEIDQITVRSNTDGTWKIVTGDISLQLGLGQHTVRWSATDTSGNTVNATQSVTVRDTTPPVIAPKDDVTVTGTLPRSVSYTAPQATDAVDGTVAVTCSPASGSSFAQQTTSVSCDASDSSGNDADTVMFRVVVLDGTAPVISEIDAITAEATGPSTAVAIPFPTVSDDLDEIDQITVRSNTDGTWKIVTGDISLQLGLGQHTVRWSATDTSGNTANATQSVTVRDTTPPVIAPKDDVTVTGTLPRSVSYTAPQATDAVDGTVAVTCSPASGSSFAQQTTSVSCDASDSSGNDADTVMFRVVVLDGTAPVISEIDAITAEATGPSTAVAIPFPTVSDDLDEIDQITVRSNTDGTWKIVTGDISLQLGLGQHTVRWSATDTSGNTANATQSVTVRDTTPPVIAPKDDVTVTGTLPRSVSYTAPQATDAVDGTVAVTCSPASGSSFAQQTTSVSCDASDSSGNDADTVMFRVVVLDGTAPVISEIDPITAEATGPSTAVAIPFPTVSDDRDGVNQITVRANTDGTWKIVTGDISLQLGLGQHTVRWSATDTSGNTANATQSVTVRDTTPPVIAPKDDVTVTGTLPRSVSYTAPQATDAVDGTVAVTCSPASGSSFAQQTTSVSCDASDSSGNDADTVMFRVVVLDGTAPVISEIDPITAEATGPSTAVAIPFPTVSDDRDGVNQITVRANTDGTWKIVTGDISLQLGLGQHTVRWSATDTSGNTANATQSVTVRDTTPPVIAPKDDVTVTGTLPRSVSYTAPQATDAVDGTVAVTCSPASGSSFAQQTTSVSCDASDSSGNDADTVMFRVVVLDGTAPVISEIDAITAEATGPSTAVAIPFPTVSDDRDGVNQITVRANTDGTWKIVTGDISLQLGLGQHTVRWSATDTSGNTANATQSVTVRDTTPPVIAPKDDVTVTGTLPRSVSYTAPQATDAVDGTVAVTCSPASGSSFAQQTTSVSCDASDSSGNDADTVMFRVVVLDGTAPVISEIDAITAEATGPSTAVAIPFPTVSDDRDGVNQITVRANTDGTWKIVTGDISLQLGLGQHTVRWSATDTSGNTANATQSVTVRDTTPPVIAPKDDVTVTGTLPRSVSYTAPQATDAVDGTVAVTCSPASGSSFAQQTTSVSCDASDSSGNDADTVMFRVVVLGGTAPVISGINPITAEATGPSTAVAIPFPTVSDDLDEIDQITVRANTDGTWKIVTGDISLQLGLGQHTVRWSATDTSGNTANATQSVTVQDTTPPVIAPKDDVTVTGTLPRSVSYTAPQATDAVDGTVAVTCSPASGSSFAQQTTSVSCDASDSSGNDADTVMFRVVVLGGTAPVISGINPITAEATGPSTAVAIPFPTVSDDLDEIDQITVRANTDGTWKIVTGDISLQLGLGQHTVRWSATDTSGNTANATQSVTVRDTTPPVIAPKDDVTVTGTLPRSVSYTAPQATDAVDGTVAVTCSPASGSSFAQQITSVSCDASDSSGNDADTVMFRVVVLGGTAPVISEIDPIPPEAPTHFTIEWTTSFVNTNPTEICR